MYVRQGRERQVGWKGRKRDVGWRWYDGRWMLCLSCVMVVDVRIWCVGWVSWWGL